MKAGAGGSTLRRAAGHLQRGETEAAARLAEQRLEARPDDPDGLHILGVARHLQRRPAEARSLLARATELRPDDATLWNSLGNAHRLAGDTAAAEVCFQRSLDLDPESIATWYNLGHLRLRRGDPAGAVAPLRRAADLNPESLDAALALGCALFRSGAGDPKVEAEAEASFLRAHRLAPQRPEPLNNLAALHVSRGDTEAALEAFRRAVQRDPEHLDSQANLGLLHNSQGRVGEAAEAYRAALRSRPDSSPVRLNLALTLLQAGYFEEAWQQYEARFREADGWRHPHWDAPRWDGTPLEGRRLLITEEQGYGDMIQFCRYATLVRQSGGEPWIEARAPLARLLATCPGVAGVVASRFDRNSGATVPGGATARDASDAHVPTAFEFQIPALSLPGVFATDLDSIPASVPYLQPAERPPTRAAALLNDDEGRLQVGLVWAGSRGHADDARRSCPLATLAPLSRVPGVRLHNLLYGERGREAADHPELGMMDLAPLLGDFHATAAVVQRLDLIITVDTSMAHLAGALGRPVWTLLAQIPDWRWLLDRNDSPWYPSMRLFRQRTAGDWAELVERVATALAEWADPTRP